MLISFWGPAIWPTELLSSGYTQIAILHHFIMEKMSELPHCCCRAGGRCRGCRGCRGCRCCRGGCCCCGGRCCRGGRGFGACCCGSGGFCSGSIILNASNGSCLQWYAAKNWLTAQIGKHPTTMVISPIIMRNLTTTLRELLQTIAKATKWSNPM